MLCFKPFIYDHLPSTMVQGRYLLTHTPCPFFVQAHRQSNGYGRLERTWESPEGNLYLTLAIAPFYPASCWHQLSFVAALALYHTVRPLISSVHTVHLKWPNDVMVEGKKIAGILLETDLKHKAILIGIGLNLAVAPLSSSTCLHDYTKTEPVSLKILRDTLINFFSVYYKAWHDLGFIYICQQWQTVGPALKSPLSINHHGHYYEGHYLGLNPEGALLLQTALEKKIFYSGDVIE